MIFATGGWASANLKNAHCSSITNLCDGPGSRRISALRRERLAGVLRQSRLCRGVRA
jgi:hypothetical protein